MCKKILYLTFILLGFSSFGQNEYENDQDNEVIFNPIGKKKFLGVKNKFNLHFEGGLSISSVGGYDVLDRIDTLNFYKNRYSLDFFRFEPLFFPYGQIKVSYNFSNTISITSGVNYKLNGWVERAQFFNPQDTLIFHNRYEFHTIGIPLNVDIHYRKFFTFEFGAQINFHVSNRVILKDYYSHNGITRRDLNSNESFEDQIGFKPSFINPEIFAGILLGSERFKFSCRFLMMSNFINENIFYNSYSVQAGIVYKLLKDYD